MKKAMAALRLKPIGSQFCELLTAQGQANLQYAFGLEEVQEWLQHGKEVCINLDQDPKVIPHLGVQMPVILASVSHMWGMRHERPLTCKVGSNSAKGCWTMVVVLIVRGCLFPFVHWPLPIA